MSMAPEGTMTAVIGLTEMAIREMLQTHGLIDIDIANLNSPTQIILSGLKESIIRAATFFESRDVRYVPLNTSGAFHSRYMEAVKQKFEAYLKKFTFPAPSIPVISNVDASRYQANRISINLTAQITHPPQFPLLNSRLRRITTVRRDSPHCTRKLVNGTAIIRLAPKSKLPLIKALWQQRPRP
ncbi:hypothetical protein NQD60_01660 [Mycoavidus sp. SF9855]|nr:acyltransferase domain-containing protein [Mycoavidus sp. SF9855]UUM21845.1 hypothetical protein NQD60_01660 [Mycoavidus sp. SF9855]